MAPTTKMNSPEDTGTPEQANDYLKEKQAIDQLFKERDQYQNASQEDRKELTDIFNAFSGKMDKVKKLPYKSKESIPKLRTESAYVKANIFSGEPEVEIEGIGEEDKVISRIYEKIINHRFKTIPNFYQKIESWVSQGTDFGTSVIFPVWKFQTIKKQGVKQVEDPETGEITEEPEEYEEPIVDEPDVEVDNLMDIFYNPLIPTVDGQKSVIRRMTKTVSEIQENEMYDHVCSDGQLSREKVVSRNSIASNPYDSTSQLSGTLLSNQSEIVEIYERITKDRIQTVADGKEKLLLRDVENPYKCINAVKFIFEMNCIPNTFNGLGTGHNTMGLGKLYFKTFNQTYENLTLVNNPMFAYKRGLSIDPKQFIAKPGGAIGIDDKLDRPISDVFQPLQFPDIKNGAVEMLNKIEAEHQRASGATPLVQGASSNATLGQDELAQQNISNRFENIKRRFNHSLAELADKLLKMDLQNIQSPDAPILRIFPQELRQGIYETIISEQENVKYNIRIKANTAVARNRAMESKRLTELYGMSQAVLTNQELRMMLRRIAERQGETDIDEMIAEQAPVEPGIDPATGQPIQMQPGQGQVPVPQGAETIQGMNAGLQA